MRFTVYDNQDTVVQKFYFLYAGCLIEEQNRKRTHVFVTCSISLKVFPSFMTIFITRDDLSVAVPHDCQEKQSTFCSRQKKKIKS